MHPLYDDISFKQFHAKLSNLKDVAKLENEVLSEGEGVDWGRDDFF